MNASLMINALDGEAAIFTPTSCAPRSGRRAATCRARGSWSAEQTTNMGGGRVWPLETLHEVLEVAREHDLRAHMDGARLMNAVVAAEVPADDYAGDVRHRLARLHEGAGRAGGAVLAGSPS